MSTHECSKCGFDTYVTEKRGLLIYATCCRCRHEGIIDVVKPEFQPPEKDKWLRDLYKTEEVRKF